MVPFPQSYWVGNISVPTWVLILAYAWSKVTEAKQIRHLGNIHIRIPCVRITAALSSLIPNTRWCKFTAVAACSKVLETSSSSIYLLLLSFLPSPRVIQTQTTTTYNGAAAAAECNHGEGGGKRKKRESRKRKKKKKKRKKKKRKIPRFFFLPQLCFYSVIRLKGEQVFFWGGKPNFEVHAGILMSQYELGTARHNWNNNKIFAPFSCCFSCWHLIFTAIKTSKVFLFFSETNCLCFFPLIVANNHFFSDETRSTPCASRIGIEPPSPLTRHHAILSISYRGR